MICWSNTTGIAGTSRKGRGPLLEELSLDRIRAQEFPNRAKTSTVDLNRAELLQCAQMPGRRIALVRGESVTGIEAVHLIHEIVTSRFGNNGSRRNAGRERVAVNDASLRIGTMRNGPGIDENKVRWYSESFNRSMHGKETGVIDVDPVNFFDFGTAHSPADGIALDLNCQVLPLVFIHDFLGVVKTGKFIAARQDNGGGDNELLEREPHQYHRYSGSCRFHSRG